MKRTLLLLGLLLVCNAGLQAQTKAAKVVDRIVAQVNDDIITLSDVNRAREQLRLDLSEQFSGDQLEEQIKKYEGTLLETLIRKKLMLQKAIEYGMDSGMDARVSDYIESLRKDKGIKDMDEFERALEGNGMTLESFREDIKKEMTIQELKTYFVDSRITLLTEEVERYYKDHTKDYSSAEEVTLSEIVIPGDGSGQAETLANEYCKRAAAGESFAALASQYSKGPTAGKGGAIGDYQIGKLSSAIAGAIDGVKAGDVSTVVKLAEGFAFFRVDARKPSVVRPFDEVKNNIKNLLYQQKYMPEFERFIAHLKEDAYIQVFSELEIGK